MGNGLDENGNLFFINTVIGHLWHALPGAHLQRMYGEDLDPHIYQLMPQIADHVHWNSAAEEWSSIRSKGVTPETDKAGGGHAHVGMMIYQGSNWPEAYRNQLYTLNLHGRRINQDTLHREGAGYVGHHGSDFFFVGDPWYRGIELSAASDGSVYVLDWSDIGECHENDGVHRTSGRIYRVRYGKIDPAKALTKDLGVASDAELVQLLRHSDACSVGWPNNCLQVALPKTTSAKKPSIRLSDSSRTKRKPAIDLKRYGRFTAVENRSSNAARPATRSRRNGPIMGDEFVARRANLLCRCRESHL